MRSTVLSRHKHYLIEFLRISKNGKEVETFFAANPAAYSKTMNYLNGTIASDIRMIVGDETVKVSDALFSPAYGTSDASSVMVIFNSSLARRRSDFKILFDDTQFGTGRHEFSFRFADIQSIPKLKQPV